MHDRRDRVEKGEALLAGQRAQRLGQGWRGQRAGGDDDLVPFRRAAARRFPRGGFRSADRPSAPPRPPRKTRPDRPRARRLPGPCAGRRRRGSASRNAAFPRAAGRPRCARHRRSGTNWSTPARRGRRRHAPRCAAPAASRAAPTGTPARASCHAASLPARPPPMMWTGFMPVYVLLARAFFKAVLRCRSRTPRTKKRPGARPGRRESIVDAGFALSRGGRRGAAAAS